MNKDDAIKLLLKKIYEKKIYAILSKEEIKDIEKFYKENYITDEEFDKFLNKNYEIKRNINKSKSAFCEVRKQFETKRGLQSGILSECYYAQTLADLLELNKFLDLETCKYNDVPVECIDFINSSNVSFNCGRYLYYNKSNKDIFIIQYGNPASGDAEIIIDRTKVRLEFKEQKAKAGEPDISGLYDETGKLVLSQSFKDDYAEYVPLIQKFNRETTVMNELGHNYNNFDEQSRIESVKRYFEKLGIDILISTNKENAIVAITRDCLGYVFQDGTKIISTEGSEIRTAGRNASRIFTPIFFERVKNNLNAIKINDSFFRISKANLVIKKARGKNENSRIKLNNVFFIYVEDIIEEGDYYIINETKVKQLVPTISIHIEIVASFNKLKEYFEVYN